MTKREQLNADYYQQAVRFAEHFATEKDREDYLQEIADRKAFEQNALAQSCLQKNSSKLPLTWQKIVLLGIWGIIAGGFYGQTGRYQQVVEGEQAFTQFQQQKSDEDSQQRNHHYIVNLQNQLRENRNNGDLWFELGQAYSLNNDFEAALVCFHNASGILGKKASLLGAMATADYYLHKQKITEQAQEWIEQALAIDAQESASLLLLASDAFLHNNPQQAITYWERALDSENQSLDRREIIKSIKLAEQMSKFGK